jgi:hypothetical protein
MKKTRKTDRTVIVSVYTVMALVTGGIVVPIAMAQDAPQDSVVEEIAQMIRGLIDPFVPRIKPAPVVEPKPVAVPAVMPAVLPVEAVPVLLPETGQPVPQPKPEEPLPPPPPPVELPKLEVSGIMVGTDHPMAIINGEVVEEGGSIIMMDEKIVIKTIEASAIKVFYRKKLFSMTIDQGKQQ